MPLGPACTCFSQGKKQPAISKYFTLIFLVSQLSMMSVTDADLLNLYFSLTSSRKYGWTLLFQVYPCDSKLLAFSSCHRFLPQAPCSPVKKKKNNYKHFKYSKLCFLYWSAREARLTPCQRMQADILCISYLPIPNILWWLCKSLLNILHFSASESFIFLFTSEIFATQ